MAGLMEYHFQAHVIKTYGELSTWVFLSLILTLFTLE